MVVVNLKGGLGNQLYQYAFALFLAEKLKTKVMFDTSWYESNPFEIELEKLGFDIDLCKPGDLRKIFGLFVNPVIARRVKKYLHLNTSYLGNDASPKLMLDNRYYDGYWQKLHYIESSLETLRSQLLALSHEHEVADNAVAIHIRGGDYFKSKNHFVLKEDYYRRAMEYFGDSLEQYRFLIFTNDQPYAKEMLKNLSISNFEIVRGADAISDFLTMMRCKHFIIGNSTYSWWAALLGKTEKSTVVAPSNWKVNDDTFVKDCLPQDWIQL